MTIPLGGSSPTRQTFDSLSTLDQQKVRFSHHPNYLQVGVEEAKQLLEPQNVPPGSFIIRPSQSRANAVAINFKQETPSGLYIRNLLATINPDGTIALEGGPVFNDISELEQYFHSFHGEQLPLTLLKNLEAELLLDSKLTSRPEAEQALLSSASKNADKVPFVLRRATPPNTLALSYIVGGQCVHVLIKMDKGQFTLTTQEKTIQTYDIFEFLKEVGIDLSHSIPMLDQSEAAQEQWKIHHQTVRPSIEIPPKKVTLADSELRTENQTKMWEVYKNWENEAHVQFVNGSFGQEDGKFGAVIANSHLEPFTGIWSSNYDVSAKQEDQKIAHQWKAEARELTFSNTNLI